MQEIQLLIKSVQQMRAHCQTARLLGWTKKTIELKITHHFGGQVAVHILEEDGPPQLQELCDVVRARRAVDTARRRVEALQPGLHGADKVQDLHVLSEPEDEEDAMNEMQAHHRLVAQLICGQLTLTHCLKAGRYE